MSKDPNIDPQDPRAVLANDDVEVAPALSTRERMRANILGAKAQSELVIVFGEELELRQPSLGVIMAAKTEGTTNQVTTMMTGYAYIPGTNEKVFEEGDADAIMELPMGPDMKRFLDAMNKLLGVEVDAKELEAKISDRTKSA